MMKKLLWSVLLLPAFAQADTLQNIVAKFYPQYSEPLKCRIAKEKEQGTYCMKLLKTETRETGQGKLMFLAFSGNHVNLKTLEEDGAHANSGLAGIFVFKEKAPNDWTLLAAKPKETVGAFGNGPQEFTFHEFGADKWGFLTTHGDVHQGFSGGQYVIFHFDGRKIGRSTVGAHYSNVGAYGDKCEVYEDDKKERLKCLARLADLDTTIRIDRQAAPTGGFYPLKLTVSGFEGKKQYRNQSYSVPYNARTGRYEEPKNYLLKDRGY